MFGRPSLNELSRVYHELMRTDLSPGSADTNASAAAEPQDSEVAVSSDSEQSIHQQSTAPSPSVEPAAVTSPGADAWLEEVWQCCERSDAAAVTHLVSSALVDIVQQIPHSYSDEDDSDNPLADEERQEATTARALEAVEHVALSLNVGRPSDGRTALHIAAAAGSAEIVRYLLQAGCSASRGDFAGDTPFDCAASSQVKAAFRELGSDIKGARRTRAKKRRERKAAKRKQRAQRAPPRSAQDEVSCCRHQSCL